MKKQLLCMITTVALLFATAGYYAPATDGGDPPPGCNPFSYPICK